MEYVIGILLLVSFVGLAVYAVRGGNLMMGMLIMGIIWTVLPLIGNTFATNPEFIAAYPGITDISFVDAITKVFQSGPEVWGSVYDVRDLLDSSVKLMDGKSPLEIELPGLLNLVKKPLLKVVKGTIFEDLLKEHGILKDYMLK